MAIDTVGLIARRNTPDAVSLARELVRRHPQLTFLVERHLAQDLGWPMIAEDAEIAQRAQLVVVMGGDGTLIHAARLLRGRPVPLLGVNLGSLGFMTEIPRHELFSIFDLALLEQCRVDHRMKLCVKLLRDGATIVEDEVFNDVVINKGALARIADHAVSICDHGVEEHVATYKADGIIVATPTGSTAYSLSAGGPIVHPSLDLVILSPICSHALTQRSIVVPSDRSIRVRLSSETADVYLTLDGQAGHPLMTGDLIEVSRSPHRVLLVRNPNLAYFAILRQKLHWGAR